MRICTEVETTLRDSLYIITNLLAVLHRSSRNQQIVNSPHNEILSILLKSILKRFKTSVKMYKLIKLP